MTMLVAQLRRKGHLPVVKALLSGGAGMLAANNQGTLLIHYAVRKRNSAVSKYLLQHITATTRRLPTRTVGRPYLDWQSLQ
jgi:ankyrin repeat protein